MTRLLRDCVDGIGLSAVPLYNWLVMLGMAGVAILGLLRLFYKQTLPQLVTLRFYLAFCVLTILAYPFFLGRYINTFSICVEVVSNGLLALMAAEVVTVALYAFPQYVKFWAVMLLTTLGLVYVMVLPERCGKELGTLYTIAKMVVVFILMALWFNWSLLRKREDFRWVVIGIGIEAIGGGLLGLAHRLHPQGIGMLYLQPLVELMALVAMVEGTRGNIPPSDSKVSYTAM
jgi:hypothetical protein